MCKKKIAQNATNYTLLKALNPQPANSNMQTYLQNFHNMFKTLVCIQEKLKMCKYSWKGLCKKLCNIFLQILYDLQSPKKCKILKSKDRSIAPNINLVRNAWGLKHTEMSQHWICTLYILMYFETHYVLFKENDAVLWKTSFGFIWDILNFFKDL